ncbi:gag-polypeptide of LTR copia-type domain-containing protein [Phthorimaea operculella]|nr:gag-polypeptide of LTR copia-type domain-containing protein [Phthorimaea operculella]
MPTDANGGNGGTGTPNGGNNGGAGSNGATILFGGSPGLVEKLEGAGNYLNWKFQLKMLLKLEGMWDLIEAEETNVLTSVDAARDQRALARICLSLKPGLFQYVREAKSSKEAWKKLSEVFEDRGLYRRVLLLRQLHRIQYNDYNNMTEYIERVTSLVQQLSDIGKVIEDEEIAEILLSGLPQEYDTLVSNLETLCISKKLQSELVRTRLLQEAHRKDETSTATAFVTKKQLVCKYCSKVGHIKPKCYKFKRDKLQKKKKDENEPVVAFLAHSSSDIYVDSGSSNHMVKDKEMLTNFKETSTQVVSCPNNEQLVSTCVGDINIFSNNEDEALLKKCEDCLKGKLAAEPFPDASSSRQIPEEVWSGSKVELFSFVSRTHS